MGAVRSAAVHYAGGRGSEEGRVRRCALSGLQEAHTGEAAEQTGGAAEGRGGVVRGITAAWVLSGLEQFIMGEERSEGVVERSERCQVCSAARTGEGREGGGGRCGGGCDVGAVRSGAAHTGQGWRGGAKGRGGAVRGSLQCGR